MKSQRGGKGEVVPPPSLDSLVSFFLTFPYCNLRQTALVLESCTAEAP